MLSNNWDAYYGGAVSQFIDWWLTGKVIGDDTLQIRAPGILRKWLKWCYQHNYFEEERYKDFLEALPRGKSKDLKRLQKAGKLLYLLHTPDPGAWMTGDEDKVLSINRKKEPEEWEEGNINDGGENNGGSSGGEISGFEIIVAIASIAAMVGYMLRKKSKF